MKKFYIISFLTVLIIIAGFLFLKPEAQAVTSGGVTSPVFGTATITNMGYKIHFLGYNGGTSGNISYNVQYNSATGFSGYGWSPEYGWVDFNGLSATALSLQNPNDVEISEWANGAIKLKGSDGGTSGNIPYSVTFDPVTGNTVNHWAWGGNVIGWIDFLSVKIVPTTAPTVTLIATPLYIAQGEQSLLSWYGNNLVVPNQCTTSWGNSTNPNKVNPLSTTTYTVSCLGTNEQNATGSATVTVYPLGTCLNPNATNFGLIGFCTFDDGVFPGTCSDGIQNQDETGIDTGGVCTKIPRYIEH